MLDAEGRIQPAFDPKRPDSRFELPGGPAGAWRRPWWTCWRRTRSSGTSGRNKDEGANRLKKEVTLSPEFQALWDRIKPKTTYRVEFETDELVRRAVDAIKRMERIEIPKIRVSTGQIEVTKGGIVTTAMSVAEEQVDICYPMRTGRAGLPAKRNRTDPFDAGADPEGIRPTGRVFQ